MAGFDPQKLKESIKRHEGCVLSVYLCPAGFKTIGYGHKLKGGEYHQEITQDVAEQIFESDFRDAVTWAATIEGFKDFPPEAQGMLIDMVFNLGIGGVLKFKKMLKALRQKDYQRAAAELRDSLYYYQVGDRSRENEKILLDLGQSND